MRLGIVLPNWIGDVVMATPAVRALRKMVGGDGELIGILRPYVAEVLDGTTWLDHRIIYKKPVSHFALADREVYAQMRAAKLDAVVLLTNSFRTAWMAWRSGATVRIGYSGRARSWLLTHRLTRPGTRGAASMPTIDCYLHLAEAAGAAPEPPRLELATTPADEQAADDVWRQLDLPPAHEVVVLNSGSAYGAAKHWPSRHFADLARRIAVEQNLAVLVNCGPMERDIAQEITDLANHPRVCSLARIEKLPIGLAKACIKRSRMLITTDSGPRFMAIAFGRPVVSLFGPTAAADTATHYERETVLSLSLDCQPCMARTCPLHHHRCMTDLTAGHVYPAAAKLLEASAAQHAA